MKRLLLTLLLAAPLLAQAHSTATFTTPADGAVLKAAPEQFMLMFNEAAKVTRLTLQKTGAQDIQTLGPLSGNATQHFMIAAPKLSPGEYTLRYRTVSQDNHIMSGVVKFSITGAGK